MRNFAEQNLLRESETGYTGSGAQILQEENNYSYIKNFPTKIRSDLTLFNPGKKEAILGNHGGGIDKDKGKMYGEIGIYIKDGKHYAKNKYGVNVFLINGLSLGTQNFYFDKVDGKYVLVAEQDGINYYFLENGEKYFPKNKIDDFGEKIIETREAMKKIVNELITKLLENISFLPNRKTKMTEIYGDKKENHKNSKK